MSNHIKPGCVYLHPKYNEYVAIISNNEGLCRYAGDGVSGSMQEDDLLLRFHPVRLDDLSDDEYTVLVELGDGAMGFMLQDGIQR